jgi:predicted phage terminase large subunit-like protein
MAQGIDTQKEIDLDRDLVRQHGLRGFVHAAWEHVDPAPLMWGWHVDAICEHLEAVNKGYIDKLIVNIPPGCMKSSTVSVLFQPWEWIENPGYRHAFISYDSSLSRRDASKSRDLIESPWYQARWGPLGFKKASASVTEYYNTAGGGRFSSSIRGRITGRHFNRIIIDDPHKPLDITKGGQVAENSLQEVRDWKKGTSSTRRLTPFAEILIMQRLHEADLAGDLIETGEYTVLKLPMRYEREDKCTTHWFLPDGTEHIFEDPRTEEGELLWPERFDEQQVQELEEALADNASAQLQQDPTPKSGALFRRDMFQYHDFDSTRERRATYLLSWDCAFKDNETGSFVVGQLWAAKGPNYYLLAQFREHVGFNGTVEAVKKMRADHQRAHTVLIEDKANGTAVIDYLKKTMSGIVAVNPEGGKAARANAVEPLFMGGNVFFPDKTKHPWVEQFEKELLHFPRGRHDDQVDAMTQALVHLQNRASHRYSQAMQKLRQERTNHHG